MTMPADTDLRAMDYDALTALALADPTFDVGAAIARQIELNAPRASVTALRAQARDTLSGMPPTPDPTVSPITAHRAAALADYARATERRQLAQTPKGTPS
jgi:hypothetical protein